MATPPSKLANAIKETISDVERTSGIPLDNTDFQSLKDILLHRLTEVECAADPEHPPVPDWTDGRRRMDSESK